MNKRNKILTISGAVIAVIAIIIFAYVGISNSSHYTLHSVTVAKGSVEEKVNLIGQVKASQGVDLAFESSGRIVANNVKVGDKIYAGQALLSMDSSILQSQLKQAEAQLLQAQAGLSALDINVVESKTDSALKTAYTSALGYVQKSVTIAKNTVIVMSDIQFNHFTGQTNENATLEQAKAKAVYSLLGKDGAGRWASQNIATLNGGAFDLVNKAIENPTNENIDTALSATLTALQDVRDMINAIPADSSLSATEKASIVTEKAYISAEIITISNSIQAISAQKVNNDATISTTNSQIDAAQASAEAIKASIQTIKTQISKTTLRALFDGQVDKNDAVVGAIVSAGTPVVTISNSNLEIQANIPEAEIANIQVGSPANVTLDAFGTSETFKASVVLIDSAPTYENGISVYKARLKFADTDQRVKAGMTANVTVVPQSHSDVLVIPASALIQKDGKYFVIVDKGNDQKESRQVTIGLKNGQNAEITSGLNEGEKVLAY